MSTQITVLEYCLRLAKNGQPMTNNPEAATELGMTKDAVYGALFRLRGLGHVKIEYDQHNRRIVHLLKYEISTARPKEWQPVEVAIPKPEPIRLDTVVSYALERPPRARTCQHMAGEDHVKCGKPVERESYCGHHYALCHTGENPLRYRKSYSPWKHIGPIARSTVFGSGDE